MKIPKTFKLLGQEITTVRDPHYFEKEDCHGMARYRENKAIIDDSEYLPITVKEEAFCHELTHWILFQMSNDLYKDEKFVTLFGSLLHQAINTMEY